MIGDASSMVVTGRSSRFRAAAPWFARGGGVRLHAFLHSCSNALLGLAALAGVAIMLALVLGGARPSWWGEGAGATSEARRTLATKVDNNAWTVATQLRPMTATTDQQRAQSEPWSVSLSSESATAWLNEKLPLWLNAQKNPVRLPPGAELRAVFEPGVVRLGVRFAGEGGGERYAALMLTPRVDGEGLWLPASSASLGRLEVPAGAVIGGKEQGDGRARSGFSRELAAVLRGEVPALPGAAIKLPDGRRVRLLKFEVVEGRVVLTMRTEAGGNGQMTNGQSAK